MAEPLSTDAARVKGWTERLTETQEILFVPYAGADGADPDRNSWALVSITDGATLDLIEQPDDALHSEISDLLYAQEEAGLIQAVACGYYRHPACAAEDAAAAAQRARYYDALRPVDAIIDQLSALAERLHEVEPARSVATHRRELGEMVSQYLNAWPDRDEPDDDVAF